MLDDDDKAVDRNYHPGCGFAPEKSEISVHSIYTNKIHPSAIPNLNKQP